MSLFTNVQLIRLRSLEGTYVVDPNIPTINKFTHLINFKIHVHTNPWII
jgi:hypothetical protein